MGWLRELMRSAAPPIAGYGELARRALAHPEWPPETQPRPRSLAALFSKLDRGMDLDWLAERDGVQRTLALVLGCPLESVHRVLLPLRAGSRGGRIRLEDLPFARPLDLLEEDLPPGIPPEVVKPAAWRRLWWHAPSGSGRSLAGQWLKARGLAEFRSAVTWAELSEQMPATGPMFVELERSDGFEAIAEELARDGICVAGPARPVTPAGEADGRRSPWRVIESPAPAAIAAPLLTWIEARLPRDGAFEAGAALAWLQPALSGDMLPTLGALLGAAGLLDVHSVRRAAGLSLVQLAERFVSERLEQASKSSAEAHWLKQSGFEVIIKLAEAALTASDSAWEVSRSEDEWMTLIPGEFRQGVDAEWMRWSLARAGGQASTRELELAFSRAPPGAYRLVRALIDARLLGARTPGGPLSIQPAFLKHAALSEARTRLLSEASPFGWGEALLRPHAAPAVLEAVYEHLAPGRTRLLQDLLELELASHPALVAASEASFVCVGLRLLCGAEPPGESLRMLWDEQLGWMVELEDELPRPRLLCFHGAANGSPLSSHGAWALAALAISEVLELREGARHPLLRPWTVDSSDPRLPRLFDTIFDQVTRPEVERRDFAVEAFALAGRWFAQSGEPPAMANHALVRPYALVRALLAERLDGASLAGFGAHAVEVRALRAECERQQVPWSQMIQGLWLAFQAASAPSELDSLFAPTSSSRRELWPHLPSAVVDAAWTRWSELSQAWPFESFDRGQWLALISCFTRRWRTDPALARWAPAFDAMELEWVERALRDGNVLAGDDERSGGILRIVWRRFPEWVTRLLIDRIAAGDAVAIRSLLRAAPRNPDAALMGALAQSWSRREVGTSTLDEACRWLHAQVMARGSEWRRAYALLCELELRRLRARRARGA